jgi:Co/Zn/Cd efflux system component
MADCCENTSCAIDALRARQSKTLKIVLWINAVMFLVVLAAGLLAAVLVFAQVIHRLYVPVTPIFETMGIISLLALLANGICLTLLWKHREEDVNMSSVWECSRNDIATNLAVLMAAGGVWLFHSGWPDLLVGFGLSLLLMRSAARVLKGAWREYRHASC